MNLDSSVDNLSFVGPSYKKRLKKLDIQTIFDLLHHVPRRYIDFSTTSAISLSHIGETVTVSGEIVTIRNQYTKSAKKIQIAEIVDESGKVKVVWFNQPYLVNTMNVGDKLAVAGELGWFGREKAFITPEYEIMNNKKKGVHTGRLIPIYPETAGVSSKWLRARIIDALKNTDFAGTEYLPEDFLNKHKFLPFEDAVSKVHFPKKLTDATDAKLRLAFNELLKFQMQNMFKKNIWQTKKLIKKIKTSKEDLSEFTDSLPFKLTKPQTKSLDEIINDLNKKVPMNRLLEGDVGSGKTIVAASASYVLHKHGLKSIYMAPTQILAEQHYKTLNEVYEKYDIKIKLVTSSTIKGSEDWDILIGTHSLLHSKSEFANVGLIVVDEQHRFGVKQREMLNKLASHNRKFAHILSMTATPIPRTVALTAYGDMDLSVIDSLPEGRKEITTWIVPPEKREGAYKWIKEQILNEKVQVFVVCPLIEESDSDVLALTKSAKKEYKKLLNIFPDLKIDLLHGKQKSDEKERVLAKFKEGKTDILVTTPVIEVGIDIPNAAIIMIESADRFGLAQLHQLRGRVGRGDKKSYCLLFNDTKSEKSSKRLNALKLSNSGFDLSETDLKLRGPGEIFGARQSGFPELKIASWNNLKLIKLSKALSEEVFTENNKYKSILKYFQDKLKAPV